MEILTNLLSFFLIHNQYEYIYSVNIFPSGLINVFLLSEKTPIRNKGLCMLYQKKGFQRWGENYVYICRVECFFSLRGFVCRGGKIDSTLICYSLHLSSAWNVPP